MELESEFTVGGEVEDFELPQAEIMVGGERVEGYELPPDPLGDERQQQLMHEARALREEHERTAFARAMERVIAVVGRREGFELRLWPTRGYLDCRRITRPDYVIYRAELCQLSVGGCCIEVWRRSR